MSLWELMRCAWCKHPRHKHRGGGGNGHIYLTGTCTQQNKEGRCGCDGFKEQDSK